MDDLGWAWGLEGDTPLHVWERFSPAYEAQAEAVIAALGALGYEARLDLAGGQDGEAVLASDARGEVVLLLHLEDPDEALRLEKARKSGGLRAALEAML